MRAQPVRAGVIIWREGPGRGPNGRQYLIEIIQGHREWLALSDEPQEISHVMGAVVDDLDKRVRTSTRLQTQDFTSSRKPFPPESATR